MILSSNFEDSHSDWETPVLFPNTEVKPFTLLVIVSYKTRTPQAVFHFFKMNKLSVIVSAHNEEAYLEKTLISLVENNFPHELIVICDSCEDRTEEIAKKFTKSVYPVNFKNISKVRNFGASKAKGNILVFSDADTIVSKNYLREISRTIERGYDYGGGPWKSESEKLLGRYLAFTNTQYNKKEIGGNFFIKKSYFEKIKGFNEEMIKGEDTDFGQRLKKEGAKHSFLEKTHIIPSERRFRKKGYIRLILTGWLEAFLYRKFRKYYNEKISKPNSS